MASTPRDPDLFSARIETAGNVVVGYRQSAFVLEMESKPAIIEAS
jgi:hypothetical protein